MQLQPNEQHILSAGNNTIILTTRRIYGQHIQSGHLAESYLYLEDISSIQVLHKSYVFLMFLGGVIATMGTAISLQNDNRIGTLCVLLTGIAILTIWWFTRYRIIAITPNGGMPLKFEARKMNTEEIANLLETIQQAKTQRINELHKL